MISANARASTGFLVSTLAFGLLLSLGGLATPAQAQDEGPQPQRYEDVTWNSVSLIDFKAEKEDRAMEIIGDHYFPEAKKAGVPVPRIVEMQTGPWDVMVVWTMRDGPSDMAWETSPESAKLQSAFREMHGEEKAQELSDEYSNAVARSTSLVGFSGRHGAPITAEMAQ